MHRLTDVVRTDLRVDRMTNAKYRHHDVTQVRCKCLSVSSSWNHLGLTLTALSLDKITDILFWTHASTLCSKLQSVPYSQRWKVRFDFRTVDGLATMSRERM